MPLLARILLAALAVSLTACGFTAARPSRPAPEARTTLAPLAGIVTGPVAGSPANPGGGGVADSLPSVSADSSSPMPAAGTEPIALDSLPDATLPASDTIGVLAYGVLAAADPYRIVISASESACLSAASSNLSDEQIDAALDWDEVSGNFAGAVDGCLAAATRQAFAVWHRVDSELADADDHQYRCVEQALAGGATPSNLDRALVACGVRG